nr:uncharacterized protein LOC128672172 [Plodia interpunctella]
MVQVKINDGVLEGEHLVNEFGGKFFSFKGIPYAAPPLGELRFKAPQPVTPWNGIRKATEFGSICYQIFDIFTGQFTPNGSEDCLYLNVYTPDLKPKKPLPVMVYIHGGAFMCGSGNDDIYGPEFLVKHDVILVTFNYRLEAFGFLCLDTEDIPGNAGMKDQVAALRWVNKNIANFGGDPNNVTIFGESAGGASVSFHLVSPMSKGLFRRAIAQSGAAFSPWAMSFQPRDRGLALAKKLDFHSEDDKELYNFFKNVPTQALCGHQLPLTLDEQPGISMSVVSEKKFGNNERFFYGDIYEVARNGIHEDVEVMTGYVAHEGFILMLNPIQRSISGFFDLINNYVDYLAPKEIRLNCKLADVIEASKSLKKFYTDNKVLTEENWDVLEKILGFNAFKYGIIQSAKFAANQNRKVYLYKFTCTSERNVFAHKLGLGKYIGDKAVTSHVDDLAYLFPEKAINHQPINDSTKKLIDNVTTLWTNFAKFGNPTPDGSLGITWEPYSLGKQKCLNIGNTLSLEEEPDKEEVVFWENLHKKYVPQQVLLLFAQFNLVNLGGLPCVEINFKMVQVKINDGVLEGVYVDSEYGGKYYSFKGIPYAAPPIGELRYKAPQPVTPWDGVRKATEHGPICYQAFDMITFTINPAGSEDCLYINVYTPEIKPSKPLPVMFFIHGGGFIAGSGNDDLYGPDFLIKQEVILVTFNYRLEALGFLCLDTEEIPGNAGMKDQVAALRWVQKNITHFGGDPNNVTIFGESAGGASVSFHLISPMSKGLFQRAIVQSGAVTNPWAILFQPREVAQAVARQLGHHSEDDVELNKFFKTVPVASLSPLKVQITTGESQKPPLLTFGIVNEKKFGDNERFFYGDVHDVVRNGIHEGVEVIVGYTDDEGLVTLAHFGPLSEVCNKINNFVDYLAPKAILTNCKLTDQIEASRSVKRFYFGNGVVTEEKWESFKKFLDFEMFNYGLLQLAKFSAHQKTKTYFYKFGYKSERNKFARVLGLGDLLQGRAVTCHADELAYLFTEQLFNHEPLTDSTRRLIDNICKLWTNFAKFGNPTPDETLGVKWVPFTLEKQEYLYIGNALSLEEHPDKKDFKFWETLHRKYVPNQVL